MSLEALLRDLVLQKQFQIKFLDNHNEKTFPTFISAEIIDNFPPEQRKIMQKVAETLCLNLNNLTFVTILKLVDLMYYRNKINELKELYASSPFEEDIEINLFTLGKKLGEGVQGEVSRILYSLDQDLCNSNDKLYKKNIMKEIIINGSSVNDAAMKKSYVSDLQTLFTIFLDHHIVAHPNQYPENVVTASNRTLQKILTNYYYNITYDVFSDSIISLLTSRMKEYNFSPFHPLLYISYLANSYIPLDKDIRQEIKNYSINYNPYPGYLSQREIYNIVIEGVRDTYVPSVYNIMEKYDTTLSTLLENYVEKGLSNDEIIDRQLSLYSRIIFGVHLFQFILGGVHNDFHVDNILCKSVNYEYEYYKISSYHLRELFDSHNLDSSYLGFEYIDMNRDLYFKIPTYGVSPAMIDYGRSSVIMKDINGQDILYANTTEDEIFKARGYEGKESRSYNGDLLRLFMSIYENDIGNTKRIKNAIRYTTNKSNQRSYLRLLTQIFTNMPEDPNLKNADELYLYENQNSIQDAARLSCRTSFDRECYIKIIRYGLFKKGRTIPTSDRAIPFKLFKHFGIFASQDIVIPQNTLVYDLYPEVPSQFWDIYDKE